jgi:hypothetical protein
MLGLFCLIKNQLKTVNAMYTSMVNAVGSPVLLSCREPVTTDPERERLLTVW